MVVDCSRSGTFPEPLQTTELYFTPLTPVSGPFPSRTILGHRLHSLLSQFLQTFQSSDPLSFYHLDNRLLPFDPLRLPDPNSSFTPLPSTFQV